MITLHALILCILACSVNTVPKLLSYGTEATKKRPPKRAKNWASAGLGEKFTFEKMNFSIYPLGDKRFADTILPYPECHTQKMLIYTLED